MSLTSKSNQDIANRWSPPIEAFVPKSRYTEPICVVENNQKLIRKNIDMINIQKGEVILAHETDRESATKIMNTGFKIKSEDPENIRSNAIFGWLNIDDIGTHVNSTKDDAKYVVLFKSDKRHINVSSYKSVEKLMMRDINYVEYERKHTLSYSEFEDLLWSNKIEDIGYNNFELIGSNTI